MDEPTFKWTIEDVENLLGGTKNLIGSMNRSSFDNNELLLSRPQFINRLISEIIAQQKEDKNGDREEDQWRRVIGELRWLLSQALIFNFNENDETEAKLYFTKDNNHQSHGSSDERTIASTDLGEMMKWFPTLAKEQIRKNVNKLTFLVETLPPGKDKDVELTPDNRVSSWKTFNHARDGELHLTMVDAGTKGSPLKKLTPPLEPVQRYGLQFEGENEKNMYQLLPDRIEFLKDRGRNVVLTMTFLVGSLPQDHGKKDKQPSDETKQPIFLKEEFIVNAYHKTDEHSSPNNIRGISIEKTPEGKEFDLYVHGATPSSPTTVQRLKIATSLKTSWFYTVQVKWSTQQRPTNSFYAVFDNDKTVARGTFKCSSLIDGETPAFYIGGLNTAIGSGARPIKSKCFTGILSNLEVLVTGYEKIPNSLLAHIAKMQTIINDGWLDNSEDGSQGKKTIAQEGKFPTMMETEDDVMALSASSTSISSSSSYGESSSSDHSFPFCCSAGESSGGSGDE